VKYVFCLLVITVFAAAVSAGCGERPPKGTPVSARDGVVRIDAATIKPGETRFFRYEPKDGGLAVFMVARTDSGAIKAALDACITCYPHGMGYTAEDGCVICAYCGTRFDIDELGTGKGNCIPVELAFEPDGSDVIIREPDLRAGMGYFSGYAD